MGARRGVTLIEAVLYIAVALGLIVGGLVFYQQASRSATYQSVLRGLQAVQGEVRAVYQVSKWPNQINEGPAWHDQTHITKAFIDMGAVPREMIAADGQQIRLTRDSRLMISHRRSGGVFETRYRITNVPEWLCTRLVVATTRVGGTGAGVLGYGAMDDIASIDFGLINPLTANLSSGDLTPGLAAQNCRAAVPVGSSSLPAVSFITRPSS